MSATPTHALPSFLRDALDFAGSFAATAVGICADVTASHLCASASSSSTVMTVDYLAMVEHGMFDGYLITRVAHCASPIEKTANLLEHEFVVLEAKHEGRVRFFSLEKVNRGAGQTSTIEMYEGSRACHVFNQLGVDGPSRQTPRRRLEFVPEAAVPLRRILWHCFKHMDKPFSVHAHNCQDFASELIDLLRLTGQASATAPEPAGALLPPTHTDADAARAAAPTDAGASGAAPTDAGASGTGACPVHGTEFAFDVGDLRDIDEMSAPQQGSATEAAGVTAEARAAEARAAEARAAEAAAAAEAEAAAAAAAAAGQAVVQAVGEAVAAEELAALARGRVAATGASPRPRPNPNPIPSPSPNPTPYPKPYPISQARTLPLSLALALALT
jgi:hypothetical protein